MKNHFLTLIFLLLSGTIFSQSGPVTLNFARPKNSAGAFSTIKILINDQHIGDIENGSTFTYKLVFSGKGSIEVLVNSSIYTKSISIPVESGGTYSFETGFADLGIFLLAVDNSAFEKQKQAIAALQSTATQVAASTPSSDARPTTPATSGTVVSQWDVNKKDLSVSYKSEKELDSEATRQEWLNKGGMLNGTSFVGGLSVLYKETDDIMLSGAGLNIALNQNIFNLKIPEYKEGPSSWSSFHFGYGLAASMNSTTLEFNSYDLDPIESTSYQLDINLNVGLTLGFGRFMDRANWRGGAIELNYRPTYSTFIPEEGDPVSNLNLTGFSFDVNGSNFTSSMNKIAPKAQLKLSFFILPPINDMPFFMSINLGALWYSKW
jgi:hypothetical protein